MTFIPFTLIHRKQYEKVTGKIRFLIFSLCEGGSGESSISASRFWKRWAILSQDAAKSVSMAAAVQEMMQWLHAHEGGQKDRSAIVQYYEHLTGVRIPE